MSRRRRVEKLEQQADRPDEGIRFVYAHQVAEAEERQKATRERGERVATITIGGLDLEKDI